MATKVNPNTEYATGATVNTKYNPFDAKTLQLQSTDKALYGKMLTNRADLLRKLNLMPQTLRLMTADWAVTEKAEVGNNPPLVVISSNRSNWIKQAIAAADAELKKRNLTSFQSVSDFRALTATNRQTVSPPIYCPKRLGPDPRRNVYVVVHVSEYDKYEAALAGSGITVVGWDFVRPKDVKPFVGFGASRFAAIEFCKTLRTNVTDLGKVWDYAWLIDDNVVALENFAGLEKVEAAFPAERVCAGFIGANAPYTFSAIKAWAPTAPRPPSNLPAPKDRGVLQQVGLWNIKYLTEQFLNFPPVYIMSAEDISLNRYFNYKKIRYMVYDKIVVDKEIAAVDGDGGEVNASRQYYTNLFAKAESGLPQVQPLPAAPPPVNVEYKSKASTVVNFVNTQLLVNKAEILQNVAACQGVEQITKSALAAGAAYIDEAPLTTTFQLNGKANQVVELYREVKKP